MVKVLDLYWLAGLMEGEGCFYCPKPGSKGKSISITLGMTDKDVMEKASKIFNSPVKVKEKTDNRKAVYTISFSGSTKPAGWMMTLYPMLGKRRQEKIVECLNFWKSKSMSGPRVTHCKRGHEYDKNNTYTYSRNGYIGRACRTCMKENGKVWDKAHPGLRNIYSQRSRAKSKTVFNQDQLNSIQELTSVASGQESETLNERNELRYTE